MGGKFKIEPWQLAQRQSLPLDCKIRLSLFRIRRWYEYWNGDVCVSFSGGKDSTVLLHLVRSLYPRVPAFFVNTGLEYPEIVEFVRTVENVLWLKPEKSFRRIIEEEGLPIVSKRVAKMLRIVQQNRPETAASRRLYLEGVNREGRRSQRFCIPVRWRKFIGSEFRVSEKCCDVMKKDPLKRAQEESGLKPYIGTMASDSKQRTNAYYITGCNVFDGVEQVSKPLSFWLEEDIWTYIRREKIDYSKIYDIGEERTGCMFCLFGVSLEEEPNRFQRMERSHPAQHRYCMQKLGLREVLEFMGVPWRNRQLELFADEERDEATTT